MSVAVRRTDRPFILHLLQGTYESYTQQLRHVKMHATHSCGTMEETMEIVKTVRKCKYLDTRKILHVLPESTKHPP